MCTQVIRRLDNDPARLKAEIVGLLSDQDTSAWHAPAQSGKQTALSERDTVVNELTIYKGAESHRHVRTSRVSQAPASPYSMYGLTTSGEFGGIIGSVFAVNSAAKAVWNHWETMDGKRVAVFKYAVDLAHSDFQVAWCCFDFNIRKETVAFQGEMFIDPDRAASSGFPGRRRIFRISAQRAEAIRLSITGP